MSDCRPVHLFFLSLSLPLITQKNEVRDDTDCTFMEDFIEFSTQFFMSPQKRRKVGPSESCLHLDPKALSHPQIPEDLRSASMGSDPNSASNLLCTLRKITSLSLLNNK